MSEENYNLRGDGVKNFFSNFGVPRQIVELCDMLSVELCLKHQKCDDDGHMIKHIQKAKSQDVGQKLHHRC